MAPPAYSSPAGPSRNLVDALARVFGIGGTGAGIDFAAAGCLIGIVSGLIGLIVGLIGIVSGMIGVVGGVLGVIASGLLGVIAGGVLGVVAGGAVGAGAVWRDWSFRGSFSVFATRAGGRDAMPAASRLMAKASPRIMWVASGLMPRAAGKRWLEEAQSYLFEAPREHRSRTTRNYLLTAPQVIVVSWTYVLARRIRLTRGKAETGQSNSSDDPRN